MCECDYFPPHIRRVRLSSKSCGDMPEVFPAYTANARRGVPAVSARTHLNLTKVEKNAKFTRAFFSQRVRLGKPPIDYSEAKWMSTSSNAGDRTVHTKLHATISRGAHFAPGTESHAHLLFYSSPPRALTLLSFSLTPLNPPNNSH